MDASVVICTRNRPELVARTIESVLANDLQPVDIAVVDQSDDDRTARVVEPLVLENARLMYLRDAVPGASRARNRGARATTGDVIAFIDDDCVAAPDWLRSIVTCLDVDPAAEMVYGQVLLPSVLRGVDGTVPTLEFGAPRRLRPDEPFALIGMSANLAVRRSRFEHLGGFDEVLGVGGPLRSAEDFDFHYRAYLAGVTMLLRPEPKVDHYGVRTHMEWPLTLRRYGFGDAAFYLKHVRCGDLFILSLMVRWVGRKVAREVLLQSGLRPRPSQGAYLSAFREGAQVSLCYGVDRRTRLYRVSGARAEVGHG